MSEVSRIIKKRDGKDAYVDGKFVTLPVLAVRCRDQEEMREVAKHIADRFGDKVGDA